MGVGFFLLHETCECSAMILRLLVTFGCALVLATGLAGCDEGCVHDFDIGLVPVDEGASIDPGTTTDEGGVEADEGEILIDEGSAVVDEGSAPQDEGTSTADQGPQIDSESVVDTGPEPATLPLTQGVSQLDFVQNIEGADVDRFVLVHAPENIDPEKFYPVVFLFHGNGGAAQGGPNKLGSLVNSHQFVAVYPNGHLKSWNMGKEASKADDVAFVGMVIDELSKYAQLDTSRMYSMGFSNGGGFSHKLAVETSHFTAIASIASVLLEGGEPTASTTPISVLQIHGTEDGSCPYDGGSGVAGHVFVSAEGSAQLWADHNGCEIGPVETQTDAGNISIAYGDCSSGKEVQHYGIVGAGHGIPPNTEGGLMQLVWSFFDQQL